MNVAFYPEVDDLSAILRENPPFLDVRAPSEFAQGAFPNALNCPLLTDDERAKVGTCYKQHGKSAALALGYRLVSTAERARRIEEWVTFGRTHPEGYLYCWRGGLRSQLVQQMMAEAGVEIRRIRWGYKGLRRTALEALTESAARSFWVLGGKTGVGKTRLLRQFRSHIDLEQLAGHRGSSFGQSPLKQPPQIHFENALAIRWLQLAHQPALIEDESRLIGRLALPDGVFNALKQQPLIILEADLPTRMSETIQEYVVEGVAAFQRAYGDEGFARFGQHLQAGLQGIARRLGGLRYQQCRDQLAEALALHERNGALDGYYPLVERLLTEYYDPAYEYQLAKKQSRVVFRGEAVAVRDWLQFNGLQ